MTSDQAIRVFRPWTVTQVTIMLAVRGEGLFDAGAAAGRSGRGVVKMPRLDISRSSAPWIAVGVVLVASFAWGSGPRLGAQVVQSALWFRTPPPSSVEAGSELPPVRVFSAVGGTEVTVAITPGTGASGATLYGSTTAPLQGHATAVFSDLSITAAATGYSLTATLNGTGEPAPPTTTSTPFAVTPAAPSGLGFASQPTDTAAGQQIAPPVTVRVQDRFGNLVPDHPVRVAVALEPAATAAALRGTLSTVTSDGIAEFGSLQITDPGESYALAAAAEGTGWRAVSSHFRILPPRAPAPSGTLAALRFLRQPTGVTAGTVLSPPVAVQVTGRYGGAVSDRDVRLTLRGPADALLDGRTVMPASSGVATFGELSIKRAGSYRLIASAAGASPVESDPFTVHPGTAVALAFTRQPGTGAERGELSRQPRVSVQDRYGNTAESAALVTLGVAPGRGASSGRLACDGNSHLATHGLVSFTGCRIDRTGGGYRLIATADGLRAALSQPFDIRPLGAGGSRWLLAAAGAGVILLLIIVTAGSRLARGRRAVRPSGRARAEPHPDPGAVQVISEQGSRTHAFRLEPHADQGTARLEEWS
jgi:hypothetical protein